MRIDNEDIKKIKDASTAIANCNWEELKSISKNEIPNFDVFLDFIDSFEDKILPLKDGFESGIFIVELPDGDLSIEVPMRAESSDRSDIHLVLTKTSNGLSVEYIYHS